MNLIECSEYMVELCVLISAFIIFLDKFHTAKNNLNVIKSLIKFTKFCLLNSVPSLLHLQLFMRAITENLQ